MRDDVVFTLIKDGDHRLSRPEDIERLLAVGGEFETGVSRAQRSVKTR
jgi:hypothetical protein